MVNTDKLLGAMAEKHYTRRKLAQAIGISEMGLRNKMNAKKFGTDEMNKIASILELNDTQKIAIFFSN